ncbi:MAG: M23 family metallopeptidase [Microthrixaceae bacterium]
MNNDREFCHHLKMVTAIAVACLAFISSLSTPLAATAQAASDPATNNGQETPQSFGPPIAGTYLRPTQRSVSDPFRMQNGPYGSGNFGLEYDTSPGDAVFAIGAGKVAFAGAVAGRLAVTVEHPDGRRSSLTGLASLAVQRGQLVIRGQYVGTALPGLHLGLREGDRYVDPAPFLGVIRRRARLVPVPANDR